MKRQELRKIWRAAAVISAALTSTVLVYGAAVEAVSRLTRFVPPLAGAGAAAAVYAIYVLGAAAVFSLKFIRPFFAAPRPAPRETARALLVFSAMAAALCELPALLGAVLFFLTGRLPDFYMLAVFSIAMELAHFPKYHNWEERMRAEHGTAFE